MSFEIIIQIVLLGIGLSMDAFSVALVDGLTMKGITKGRSFFIAGSFGFMQGFMPLVGFWIVELVERIAGSIAGEQAGTITGNIVVWVAFVLLLIVGGKMLIESIIEIKKPQEEKEEKQFSYKNVLLYSVLTAIDALAAGVTMHAPDLSTTTTVWLHVVIIMAITFGLSLVGLFLGTKIIKLLKGRYEISGIIGGCILILLAVWVLVSHLCNL